MKKYRPPLTTSEINELTRLSHLNFSNYTEADVREEFLVELLKLLGYRKELDYSVSREESFKLNPLLLMTGSKRIKLDYLCSLRKQYFWIIDAKEGKSKKSAIAEITHKDIAQAHFYSLHPEINCPYFVVSNGWFTNLYDRDKVNENFDPVLSIKHTELVSRFIELDSYIGSTQILPKLKEKMLDQIEKIFRAEINIQRLDEFVEAVKTKANAARPDVRKAALAHFAIFDSSGFGFLNIYNPTEWVYTIFQSLFNRMGVETVSEILIARLKNNRHEHSFDEYFFFHRLSMENPYPVNYWYYPMVLHFLLQLNKSGIENTYYQNTSVETLVRDWLDLCIFHLSDRPELRFMWSMERLHAQVVKQSIILLPVFRDKIKTLLETKQFYLSEEVLSASHLNAASEMVAMIEKSTETFRGKLLQQYYSDRKFKSNLAMEEYHRLVELSTHMTNDYQVQFNKLRSELGQDWSEILSFENIYFDRMGSAVMDILIWNEDQLYLLTEEHKKRIKLLAELGYTNFAANLCKKLGIAYDSTLDEATKEANKIDFFNPSINQRTWEYVL